LKADVGIAYDGDGDRMGMVNERGDFTSFDRLLAAYAAFQVRKHDSPIIVTHVAASMCIEKMVEAYGGKVIRSRVGDVNVAFTMKKFRAVFGGEPCGAWIHPQYHYCPDGILSSILVLKALEEGGKLLSEFISETPEFPLLKEKIECSNAIKYSVMEEIAEELLNVFPKAREVLRIDGVRLSFDEGWLLVRASGTEPLIRVTVEANSLKEAKQITRKVVSVVRRLVKKEMKNR
jgi:phosphoglucosamine mutase